MARSATGASIALNTMNQWSAIAILVLLLFGPLLFHWIERNLEAYFLALGVAATLLAGGFHAELARTALSEPIPITAAVVGFALLFRYTREPLDRAFARLRGRFPRPLLTAVSVFVLAAVSSVITVIVAALVLVEIIGLLRLDAESRAKVAVAGCFAVGMGAALTPLGEPLSTLAAHVLGLPFFGLFFLLGPYMVPGIAASAILAGWFSRGAYEPASSERHVRETVRQAFVQGIKVFAFIAGLILISDAFGPFASRYVGMLRKEVLFWANTVSAVLDNATLVALEVHDMSLARAREAILSLLISGGLLIPGNIPNIIVAGLLRIRSGQWARIALPIGLVMLGIYFAALNLAL
jgi:predicted cation transporter